MESGMDRDITERKIMQKLWDIIEFLPDATFVIDQERKVIAWNRAIVEMTGVPKEGIIGKGEYAYGVPFYGKPRPILIDFVFTENCEAKRCYDFIDVKDGTIYGEVFISSFNNGEGAFLWGKASPLFDSSGNLIGAIESIRDISEQKRTEKELRKHRDQLEFMVRRRTAELKAVNDKLQSEITERILTEEKLKWNEALLRLMANSSPLAFFVVDNRNDDILYFNHRFCEIWGLENLHKQMFRGELKNNDIIPFCVSLIKDAPSFIESCKPLQNEENRAVVEDEIEFTDGRTIRRYSKQIRGGGDNYFGRFYIFEDITERKVAEAVLRKAKNNLEIKVAERTDELIRINEHLLSELEERKRMEEALRESEAKYRSLFENSLDVDFITSRNGEIIDINQSGSELFGYSRTELLSMNIKQIYANPPDRFNFIAKIEEQGFLRNYLIDFKNKSGKKINCLASTVVRRDKRGRIIGYEGVLRDITEKKKTEEELKHSMEKLRKALEGTIQAMAKTVEMRDPYTSGHQQRVSNLARAIAREMGMSKENIDEIGLAAIIHDIGKIYVPAEILSKPGKITEIEFNLIKTHTQVGYDILKTIEFTWPIAQIIQQHHERMNGSGYPLGLAGKDILLEARILAVADVVEAMSSHRPYRPSLGIEKAIEEISCNRGVLYDSDVADACLRLFQKKEFEFDFSA
jgi:PAS domain S-box-containing protein/putative nucleotidyltransferase with HDIG domain